MAQSSSTTLQQVSLSSSLTSSPYAPTHLEHTLLNPTPPGGGLAALEYSLTPDLSTLVTNDIDPGPQKVSLLARNHPTNTVPPQSILSSSPLGNHFDDNVLSRMMLASADTSPLSRQRDYYFDTEDPSVNLQDFIVNSLQAPKNRVILLQLEDEFLKYVSDPKRTEPLKLPSWDSYHRMLAHRVAAYFGLEHNVDPQDKTRVVVLKGPSTRLPQQRFSDHIPSVVYEEADTTEPKLILKRMCATSGSEKFDGLTNNAASEIKTFEEREEEYEKARARIFSQSSNQLHESDAASIPFDLFSSSPFSQGTLRTSLHHRRTFSDTAFINKLFSQKENKPGPSSSGNSPCSTPAFFPPSPPTLSASSSNNVINQSAATPEDTQLVTRQHPKRMLVTRPQQPTYMPLYSMPGSPTPTIPIMYHPQAVIDPNWYYNHMVFYPVAAPPPPPPPPPPQQTGYAVPHVVQSPVLPHYSLPQHLGASPRMSAVGIRVPQSAPVMPHHLGSPTHPHPHHGGVVYRPLPQQALGVQLKSEEYGGPAGSTNQGPIWSPQGVPVYQSPSSSSQYSANMMAAAQLAEQMEKDLSLTTEGCDRNEAGGGMPPVGQRQPMYVHGGHVFGARGPVGMYGYPMHAGIDQVVVSPTGLVPPPPHSQYLHRHDQIQRQPHPSSFPPLSLHGGDSLPPGILQPGGIQSPVQILGHTLSTSIFSPPPSAGPSGLFMPPSLPTGKSNAPGHSAVGSAIRFQRYDPPKQLRQDLQLQQAQSNLTSHDTSNSQPYKVAMVTDNGGLSQQPLPPRLAQRGAGGGGGSNRYQNQRHPSNRSAMKSEQPQYHYTNNVYTSSRKEPLLPTPNEMIKLDTGITAGVPVHIMEVLNPLLVETTENQQLISRLKEHGAIDFKRGWINRNTEVMVAIFDSCDSALQALKQCVLPTPAKLSIPLPTHAKHILQLL